MSKVSEAKIKTDAISMVYIGHHFSFEMTGA